MKNITFLTKIRRFLLLHFGPFYHIRPSLSFLLVWLVPAFQGIICSELSPRIFLGTEKASSLREDIHTCLYFKPFDPLTWLSAAVDLNHRWGGSFYATGEMTGGTGGWGHKNELWMDGLVISSRIDTWRISVHSLLWYIRMWSPFEVCGR